MTVDQRIQWIPLPAGHESGNLRISVFVAPRLRTDEGETLALFPDFLDWPSVIRRADFSVQLPDGSSVPMHPLGDPPDSALWMALFGQDTPLAPFVFDDFADRPFVTYSVGDVVAGLRNIYATAVAAAPDDLPSLHGNEKVEPPVQGLLDMVRELRAVTGDVLHAGVNSAEERAARVSEMLRAARVESARRRASGAARGGPLLEPLPSNGQLARHFERALLFHTRPENEPVEMPLSGEHFKAQVDFHQMLSALGDHPWLMRLLGLVIDLEVAGSLVPQANVTTPGTLMLQPAWRSSLGAASVDVCPKVAYAHQSVDGETFFAVAPRQSDPAIPANVPPTGLLPLPQTVFALEHVDVDGAALKALNLAATLEAIAQRLDPERKPLHEPDQTGLPALRTGGLALVRAGRADALQKTFTRYLDLNDGIEHDTPQLLFAEDVLRGYRLDVFDDSAGAWYSLHRRVVMATAERLATALSPIKDEGFFQLSLAGAPIAPSQLPDPNGELYVHETMVTWDGWSLSAPRPGKSLSRDPSAPSEDDPATQPVRVPNDPLTATGLRMEIDVESGSLPRLRFLSSYRVRVRTVDLAGNGSTLGEADRWLASPLRATPALLTTTSRRYQRFEPVPAPVLVPRTSFAEGVSLRRLVIRSNTGMTAEEYVAAFNASEFVTSGAHPPYEPHDERHVAPPKASFELAERHGMFDEVMGSDGSQPTPERQAAIREAYEIARQERGSLEDVHPEAQIVLPYLPDPLADGVLFFGLPGQPTDEPFEVSFDAEPWHEARPLLLRLIDAEAARDGDSAPEWDANVRVLTVKLPQATSAIVRVNSRLRISVRAMGMVRWCEQTLHGSQLDAVMLAAKQNCSWLITPWHEVELVHAVQQPLAIPKWNRLELFRGRDDTYADLVGIVSLHGPSTEKVDLVADWSETVDDLAQAGPEMRGVSAVVFDLALSVAAQGDPHADPHEIPYSLRGSRLLTFSTAMARRENLPTPIAHAFGDTRYRRVNYRVVATTPFREDFPADWLEQPELLSRTSSPQAMDVPNSAPPTPPKVMYAVPTQGWETSHDGADTVRTRRGGGLRVYLERPWFSSGDGELLGVVIGPDLTSHLTDVYRYMTLIGQDPLRGGAQLEFATNETFRNALGIIESITPLELSESVSIATFEPVYDSETARWFSDIDLDTADAYMPFVRLALVRYQEHSLSGCELSPIVLVDIVQTLPDRTLTITRDGDALEITLTGPTYTAIRSIGEPRADGAALARVVARLERRDPAIADDVLGWRAIDTAEVQLDRSSGAAVTTWVGHLEVPSADGSARRLVVVEEDHLEVDEQTPELGARVVYADALEL
jgi:hypothetical protein